MLGPGNGTRRRHVQAAELSASLDPHRPWGTGDDQRNASPPPKGPPPEPSPSLTLRRSSPASRSFVLAPLRALHLDPGSGRRARRPRGRPQHQQHSGLRYAETVLTQPAVSDMPFGAPRREPKLVVLSRRSARRRRPPIAD